MSYGGGYRKSRGGGGRWRGGGGGGRGPRGRGNDYYDNSSYHGSSYNSNQYYDNNSQSSSYSHRNNNYDYNNNSNQYMNPNNNNNNNNNSNNNNNGNNNNHNSHYRGNNGGYRGNNHYNNNYRGNGGGYNNNNNGYRGRNNHYNNSGGYGGGGNRGRGGHGGGGRGGKSSEAVLRYHDSANDGLNRQVMNLNKDHPGPQQIRVLKYNASHWEAVESLTRGYFYYHNRVEKSQPIRKSKPQELKDRTPVKTEYRRYTVSYAARPTEWPSNMPVVILKTNSFQVRGKILETEVHQFEVTFEPTIKSEHVQLREKVVLGSTLQERRRNYELLRQQFGEFQFDNHALYSMGTDKPNTAVVFVNLHNDYRVTFHCIDSFRLSDPTIPIQQQEALLNIFNRKRLQKTGFSRIGRGWYKKGTDSCNSNNHNNHNGSHGSGRHGNNSNSHHGCDDGMQEISIPSNSSTCPDVNIIHGFECSMRILPKNGNRQLTVFKADLSHKLVERLTLHDRLLLMRRQCSNDNEFRNRAEKDLKKRHFLLSYNKRNLQIFEIDWDQSENSLFELQTGGKISYKQYLQNTYHIKSPKREICVIKDKGGAAFLPQHIRLTITSKQTDAVYDEVLNWVNPRTDKRLMRIENFVQHINNTHIESSQRLKQTSNNNNNKGNNNNNNGNNNNNNSNDNSNKENNDISNASPMSNNSHSSSIDSDEKLSVDFEIDEESLTTPAVLLTMPRIIIQGEKGPLPPQPVDKVKYFQTKGFLGNVKKMTQWGVVFERKHEKSFQQFERAWESYIKKRDFDPNNGPINRPQPRPIDHMLDENEYPSVVRRNDQFLVVILPDGIRGSEVKAKFTKLVQQSKFPCPVLVQCIQSSTCRKIAACLGTFDDIMIKFGNVIYEIDPMCPHGNDYIDPLSSWVIGIDVSHVKDKPSVVMVSLSRNPFEGSLKSMHFLSHLNPSRKEIVAFANMVTLMYEVLKEAYLATLAEEKKLPNTIWIFRDGVADGQIQELFTKEVVGIQRALTMFREKTKLKHWRPCLEYILCNKNTIDRFGLLDQNTGLCRSLDKPCVIYAHILSDRLWDFIIFPYHYRKHPDRTKGVRYIVLVDGLKLAEKKGGAIDLFQFIFGLTYMFAFCLPFPLGGTAQPAPIVYAKHYAESFSQTILSRDRTLDDLQTNKGLVNRPHIVTNVVLEKQS